MIIIHNINDNIIIKLEDDKIHVKHELTKEENIIVVYSQNRNNKFFDMSQLVVQNKNSDINDFTGETVMTTVTDFISPYGLMAVNNTSNNKSFTVGGAHATNGSDGLPTGRFDEISYIKLDGQILYEGGIYKGKHLELKVDQFIFASNVITEKNSRDSLMEERTYSITSQNHEVEVNLTALEDIILTRYAGLQMTQPEFYNYFYFPGSSEKYKIKDEPQGLYTLNEKSYEKLNRAVFYNDTSMLIMKTDRDYGIGTGKYAAEHSAENPQSPLTYSGGKFGKIYSHNLGRSDANLKLEDGENISYRGGYYFRKFNSNNKNVKYQINKTTYKDEMPATNENAY